MRSPERVAVIDSILRGIAYRSASKFKGKSADDIAQDLWVKILETEEKRGKELDLDLIAKICYDEIVSMQRYEMKRNHISIEEVKENEGISPLCSHFESPEEYYEIEVLKELFRIFPKDSKEYVFLEYWGNASGFIDTSLSGNGKYNEGFTEKDLARRLGYTACSSGYVRFKHKMRAFVKSYLGN